MQRAKAPIARENRAVPDTTLGVGERSRGSRAGIGTYSDVMAHDRAPSAQRIREKVTESREECYFSLSPSKGAGLRSGAKVTDGD